MGLGCGVLDSGCGIWICIGMGTVRLGLRLGSGYRISELVLAFPLGWGLWGRDGGCWPGMLGWDRG